MKEKPEQSQISFRPISTTQDDLNLLLSIYASTRQEEMEATGWSKKEINDFLRMQFFLQHNQYLENYKTAHFEIILFKNEDVGRLYVDRRKDDIRIIDIALLPQYRRLGIGSTIMGDLINESDQNQIPISLHVEHNNPALNLYENLGFKTLETKGIYYFMQRKPKTTP